jgi:hypothetical protein
MTGSVPNTLTSERDQRLLHRAAEAAKRERFVEGPFIPPPRATFTIAQDFESLARVLSGYAGQMRQWHEGTEYEQLACEVRHHPETYLLAQRAERLLGLLAHRSHEEHERFLEIHREELNNG